MAVRNRERSLLARSAHGVLALLCAVGLATSGYLGWTTDTHLPEGVGYAGGFGAGWEHLVNQPAYFTVLSALLVMVTSAMLALRPGRTSQVFHAVRLAGVAQMIITGLVFNILLRDGSFSGVQQVNDTVLHVAAPIATPVVWLLCGPHGYIRRWAAVGSLAIPVAWLAVTLLRGPLLDWYPYDILDVPGMGYSGVLVYIIAILSAYTALAGLLWWTDRMIGPGRSARRGP